MSGFYAQGTLRGDSGLLRFAASMPARIQILDEVVETGSAALTTSIFTKDGEDGIPPRNRQRSWHPRRVESSAHRLQGL